MPLILRFALLVDISTIWLEACFPRLHGVWPFTLNHLLRIGLLLLGAAIVIELWAIIRGAARKFRRGSDIDRAEEDEE